MAASWFQTPRRRAGKKAGDVAPAGMQERPVQRGAIRLLAMHRIEAVHVAALRKDGLRPGFPDLILFGPRPLQIGFVEVKREIGNGLSEDQEGWRDDLIAWGFPWAMIRQPEEALDVVRGWGWIR